ncbi:hypothetical protein HY839_02755 [Candidatus Azambacteria bacterium]|nr:hypothetical protein [Candidatus Azambacteria bacterium]
MNEAPPDQEEKERKKGEIITLARELSESQESFPFPGIESGSYEKLKAADEEFPGFVTPIDELIVRFESEGMKVALGEYPDSGNVFILPSQSNDIEMDSILPRHLRPEATDEKLNELILLSKEQK